MKNGFGITKTDRYVRFVNKQHIKFLKSKLEKKFSKKSGNILRLKGYKHFNRNNDFVDSCFKQYQEVA